MAKKEAVVVKKDVEVKAKESRFDLVNLRDTKVLIPEGSFLRKMPVFENKKFVNSFFELVTPAGTYRLDKKFETMNCWMGKDKRASNGEVTEVTL